ncbi:hypothetical protein [Clostridium perfringens]|uniref:hypothetical protein n=1 Tax=Clostridium perfringens TaxID=1502 RepID=UPI003CECB309
MIKIKMGNGDTFLVDDTRRSFISNELYYDVEMNFGQTMRTQRRGLYHLNDKVTINVDQICSIEDIED